jgi:hypothetical protein
MDCAIMVLVWRGRELSIGSYGVKHWRSACGKKYCGRKRLSLACCLAITGWPSKAASHLSPLDNFLVSYNFSRPLKTPALSQTALISQHLYKYRSRAQ